MVRFQEFFLVLFKEYKLYNLIKRKIHILTTTTIEKRVNLNFLNKNLFVSSLDTNLNFSYLKNLSMFSLDVYLIFFFFFNITDFEIKKGS